MATVSASTLKANAPVVLSATSTSKLSEDYVATLDVVVDLSSTNPIAVFPDYNGDMEAIAIRSDKQLIHIYRNWGQKQSESAWNIVEISGATEISEVVAGQDGSGTVQAFYRDSNNLYQISLNQDNTWTSPTTLPVCSSLQATVDPNSGNLIISGVTPKGDLQFVQQSNNIWSATTIDFKQALQGTSPYLVIPQSITDQMNWELGVVLNNTFNLYTGVNTAVASGPMPVQANSPADQILVGYYNYNSLSPMFMFSGTDHALYTAVKFSNTLQVIPNTQAVAGAGLINSNTNLLQVYSIDPDGKLWVLHQTGWDSTTQAPLWAPNIPLDTGLVQVAISGLPQDFPTLFGAGDDGTVHYISKDPNTGLWSKGVVQYPLTPQQATTQSPYRVTTYRTQVNIVDQYNNPQINLPVTLSCQTEIAVMVGGKTYQLNANQTASVTTNAMGLLTIVTPARGLRTPTITVTAENLPPCTVQPDGEIHTYLAGNGPINNLPALDSQGTTLQNATVDGAPLAPGLTSDMAGQAAQGIQSAMKTQAGPNGQASLLEAEGVVGWALDLRDRNNPKFTRFHSHADMEAYKLGAFAEVGETVLGDWWNDVSNFFTDVWNGIKSAAIAIDHWIVDTANKVVSFFAKVGEEIVHLADLVIQGIEEVISIVQSIFAAIAAFVEKVIKWLEALFSWQDIIDTKNALIQGMQQSGPYIQNLVETQAKPLVKGFFTNAEQAVTNYFNTLEAQVEGKSMQDFLSNAQPTPSPAAAHPLLMLADGTALQPSTFSGNVHNNSILDKILNFLEGGPDDLPSFDLTELMQDFSTAVTTALTDFETAFKDAWDAVTVLFTDPKDFATIGLAKLLDAVKELVLAALAFADGIVETLLDLIVAAVVHVDALLTQPLEIPLITPLLQLIGIPSVSIADVFCMVAAVPLTVVYKLINGADAKLFPGGVLPSSPTAAAAELGDVKQAMTFTATGLMAVWALMDTCLDTNPSDVTPPFFLVFLDLFFPTLIQCFTIPTDDGIPYGTIPTGTVGEQLNLANWCVGWAIVALNISFLVASKSSLSPKTVARYSEAGKGILTGLGALGLATGIAASVKNSANGATTAANVLSPLPTMFQFLRLETIEESSLGVSVIVKLAMDFWLGEGCAIATAAGA